MANADTEYKEVNAYLRHYSSLRFVMVSVYFAVSAAVVSAALRLIGPNNAISFGLGTTLRVIGLGITIVFFNYEWRLEQLIRYYQARARDLEEDLPYKTMQKRPGSNRTFYATRTLYIMFTILWLVFVILFREV